MRPLGRTGILVSVLGLGTVKIGRNQQVKYPDGFELPDDAAVRNLLALARELGINLIDTAPAYGSSEERLGRLLPDRQDWVIVTKVGESFEHGQSSFDFSARATRASVERSLRRLGREMLDVVLVHSDGNDMHIIEHEGVLGELARLKQEGLIKAYGLSGKTCAGGLWSVEHCDVVMATCNRQDTHDLPVIAAAHRARKGVLIKKGLQSGHAGHQAGADGVEDAIRYVLSQAGVSSIIVGTINPGHLRDNAAIAERICRELAGC
ncbi:MAG: aldo/keto reductase [Gammaproteobacteria bacterium RBG_16_57_12]|nr:MAG: aldo/keto reductase [Gammaproteobacteria bacterium RBG_16_57_12]